MFGRRDRDFVADGAVGPVLVVEPAPSLHPFARIREVQETMRRQALLAELRVERLDERVVRRLSRPREVERDAVSVGLETEVARDELTAVVHPDRLWMADLRAHRLEHFDDILAAVAEARIDRGAEP